MLIDSHGRKLDYVRLAVTDRCNLRCFYCMPHEGIDFLPKKHLLNFEEMIRAVNILTDLGVHKLRITGGEPFVRKDMMLFLKEISKNSRLTNISITTNGVLTAPYVGELKELGIKGINLSLDSLDRSKFYEMTRRDELPQVLETLNEITKHKIPLKINSVVLAGKNDEDILPLVELARDRNVDVRFIEEMPFNGEGLKQDLFLSYIRILDIIREKHPSLRKLVDGPNSTSYSYSIDGFKGKVSVIAAYSRTFCGTCNRLRLTPTGDVRTCLYADSELNIRDLMRQGESDEEIKSKLKDTAKNKAIDGFMAEKSRQSIVTESMTTIGG